MINSQTLQPTQRAVQSNSFARVLLLGVYILGFVVLFYPQTEYASIFFTTLLLTSVALWFGPLLVLGSHGQRKFYDPATVFNLAVFYFGIKAIPLAWGEQLGPLFVMTEANIERSYPTVAIFATLGLLAWNIAYTLWMNRNKQAIPAQPKLDQVLFAQRGVFLLTAVGLVSFFLLFRSLGAESIFVFLTNPHSRGYIADPTQGAGSAFGFFWLNGTYMLIVASIIWLVSTGSQNKKPSIWWWLHAAMTLWIVFLISPRSNLLGYMISVLVVFHLMIARINPLVIMGTGGMALVYSYVTNIWRSIVGGMSNPTLEAGLRELSYQFNIIDLATYIGGTDLADIRIFVLITNAYGEYLPLKYGETFLRLVTQLIPRALWADKPYDLGVEIGRLFASGSLSGTPPGFMGEMYMNFSYFGVVIGCGVLGLVLAAFYRNWIMERLNVVGIVFYAILIPRIFIAVSSTFANVALTLLITLVSAAIALRFSVIIEKPSPAPTQQGLPTNSQTVLGTFRPQGSIR